MKTRSSFAVTLILLTNVLRTSAASDSLSLSRCYLLAKNSSESLLLQKESILQSQAQARATLGGVFPQINWKWRGTRQDNDPGGDSFGGLLESKQIESGFSLEQPLFNGLKEWSAWYGLKKQEARDAWLLKQSELALFREVSEAYFNIRSIEKMIANNKTAIALAEERVTDLTAFYRLGKSKESELFSAQSEVASLKAARVRLKGQYDVARETLSFLTGRPTEEPLTEFAPPSDRSVDHFLAMADRRPDIEAQRQEVLGQIYRVRYEKGQYWPAVNLFGNYYTQRPALYKPVDWDVSLGVGIPLFRGGTTTARVREARSQLEQSRLTLRSLERRAASDVRKSYASWRSSAEELAALEESAKSAEKSYAAQKRDYRLGLVINLDVLTSLHMMQAAQQARDEAAVETERRAVALFLSAGDIP